MSALLAGLGAGLTATGKAYEGILDDRREDKQLQDQRNWELKKMKIAEKYRVDALKEQRDYDAGLLREERKYDADLLREERKYDAEQNKLNNEATIAASAARAGNSGELDPEKKTLLDFYTSRAKTFRKYADAQAEEGVDNAEALKQAAFYEQKAAEVAGAEVYSPPKMVKVSGPNGRVINVPAEVAAKLAASPPEPAAPQAANPAAQPEPGPSPQQDAVAGKPTAPIYLPGVIDDYSDFGVAQNTRSNTHRRIQDENETVAEEHYNSLYEAAAAAKRRGDTAELQKLKKEMESFLRRHRHDMDFQDLGLFEHDSEDAVRRFTLLFNRQPRLE